MSAPGIESVFIVEEVDNGWIIERLMRDIAAELNARGVTARVGLARDYAGETVLFNSRYLTPFFDKRAAVNALFVTHIDDKIREMELKTRGRAFNSLVCMSPQEADF